MHTCVKVHSRGVRQLLGAGGQRIGAAAARERHAQPSPSRVLRYGAAVARVHRRGVGRRQLLRDQCRFRDFFIFEFEENSDVFSNSHE